MSACPSCIVYCDFGFCCGSASDDDLECHAPPPPLPPPPPCHGHTEVITMVNAPIQLPPPHPHVPVPYNQLPPPLPAPPHPLPPAPKTMVYDTPPPLQAIVPRHCVPPLPTAEVYDDGRCSSPLPVRKSTQHPKFGVPPSRRHGTDDVPALMSMVAPRQCVPSAEVYGDSPLPVRSNSTQLPKFGVASSRRYQTEDDPAALSMVPPGTKAPSTPAACDAAPALQHPVEPSTDFELGMEYYSQQQHQEYFLMQGRS